MDVIIIFADYIIMNGDTINPKIIYKRKPNYYKDVCQYSGMLEGMLGGMLGGSYVDDLISKQTFELDRIINNQNMNNEESKQKIIEMRSKIQQALSNHEKLREKAEKMCNHLKRVDEFLVKLKSKQCDLDELANLTFADLLDETKFNNLCISMKTIPSVSTMPSMSTIPSVSTISSQFSPNNEIKMNDELNSIATKINNLISMRRGKIGLSIDDVALFDHIISDIRLFIQNANNNLNFANEKARTVNNLLVMMFNDIHIKKYFLNENYKFTTVPEILQCLDNCTRKVETLFHGIDGAVQNKIAGDRSFMLPKILSNNFALGLTNLQNQNKSIESQYMTKNLMGGIWW